MSISATQVKELRDKTGAGFMDAKKALEETGGNQEKAMELLRQKGIASAERKWDVSHLRTYRFYIHNGQIG